ncbi:MAG: hypothetical protein B7Z29_21210 [Hyphomicrobium sp. 12-62-95]|nr:MAG: hypothetical protein B7Z29_21210 [Hyphomicrobium sp. 12-62-95]
MDAPELIVTNSQGTAIVTEQVRHPRDVTYIRSDLLIDPNAVHMNMLRGTLAKPSVDQIVHIYGPEALAASPEVAKLVAEEREAAVGGRTGGASGCDPSMCWRPAHAARRDGR